MRVCAGVAVSERQRPERKPASKRGGMYEKLYGMRRLPHCFVRNVRLRRKEFESAGETLSIIFLDSS
jgi:hypothetical protein